MNPNVRPVDALLAVTATWAALMPVHLLLTTLDWVNPALVISMVIVAAGMLGRMLLPSRWAVVGLQVVAAYLTLGGLHLRGHLWHGIPLLDAIRALNNLLYDARIAVVTYAAPAPTSRGMVVALTVIIALLVILVDATAVTHRAPALAGLGLLSAYLITATNTGAPLAWWSFALPAGLWLVLMARTGISGLRRWSTTVPLTTGDVRRPVDGVAGFTAAARNVGIATIVCALVVAWAMPHPNPRFLSDGLGRAAGGSGGPYQLSTTLDLLNSLENQSDRVILRYRTSATTAEPIPLAVLEDFSTDGRFTRARSFPSARITSGERFLGIPDYSGVEGLATERTFVVERNEIGAPQIALPANATSLTLPDDVEASRAPSGTVDVAKTVESYSATYDTLKIPRSVLEQSNVRDLDYNLAPGVRLPAPGALDMDELARPLLESTLADIVPDGASDFDAATAIQDYLRSSAFTYSLTLAPDPVDSAGVPLDLDPVSRFLVTKVGYCQQFASAMIMLARARGIPARMVIGFLPGSLDKGARDVRAADAHAWPELYFEPYGWLRFEPTPGARSGVAPIYTQAPVDDPSASSSTTSSSPRPTQRPDQPELNPSTTNSTGLEKPIWRRIGDLPRMAWIVIGLFLGVLGALVVPVSARVRRRRQLARAADEAGRIEVRWRELTERLADLGIVAPDSFTPRQAESYVTERGVLDPGERAAMTRVVTAVELARYAPPSATLADPTTDVDSVVKAVASSRRLSTRLYAALLPGTGRRAVTQTVSRVVGAPGRAARSATGRLADWWAARRSAR
ncbi:MAG: DUF3488 and transglutaminase-like domain-containing protein [Tetrasphaera jenkinsii]|jgi:transglutaminase-like putative cysteine protease|nr:DUF3488 and transglutaminase-like domain-containing protein [Tetrasphaera jenkinsii]